MKVLLWLWRLLCFQQQLVPWAVGFTLSLEVVTQGTLLCVSKLSVLYQRALLLVLTPQPIYPLWMRILS